MEPPLILCLVASDSSLAYVHQHWELGPPKHTVGETVIGLNAFLRGCILVWVQGLDCYFLMMKQMKM